MKRLLTALLVTFCLAADARGDGAYFTRRIERAAAVVSSPRQEAVMILRDDRTEVTLRTHFNKGPKELAWIVPVPAEVAEVEPAEDRVFEMLESETAPKMYTVERGWKPACTCAGRGQVAGKSQAVTVEASGTAGVFEWTALAARDAEALTTWLDDNGYATPEGAAAVFSWYVDDGWHWLAIKVRTEATEKPTLAPHPIRYAYRPPPDAPPVYPLAISRLSASDECEVLLYVLANGRYGTSNWPYQPLPNELETGGRSPSEAYAWYLREATAEAEGYLFVAEYAGDVAAENELLNPLGVGRAAAEPTYLTRLRAVVKAEAMTRDVRLEPLSDDAPSILPHIYLVAAGTDMPTARLACGLGGLVLARVFYGRRSRRAGLAALLSAGLIFAAV